VVGLLLFSFSTFFVPTPSYADGFGGSGFESRMENIQNKFINVVLPLMSILGLVYAGVLAASGNEAAKGKIMVIIIGSIVGFLAPHIIGWIKGILS
jgi:hypothetical protein